MPADLKFTLTGGASNSDPDASLGGTGSSVELSATPLNNLFDNVDPDEASAGDVEYRAIDILNDGDEAAENVELYIDSQTSSADTVLDLGLDSTTQTIEDEDTAPGSVTFTAPTEASPLSVSNIAASGRQRVWVRRTVSSSAGNTSSDQAALAVKYA